ncbi:MAG: siphovirus Gp157 family protein [Balneola sp.]
MQLTTTPTQKESLFQIGEHFHALEELLEETEGEITEEIDQWLAEYEGKQADKVDAYCYLIQKFTEIAEEAQRLAARSASYRKKTNRLKDRLKVYLETKGTKRLETTRFTVTVASNGGRLPVHLCEFITPDELPDPFVRVVKEPDMNRLREALQAGDEFVHQFAQLGERGTHLRIN